MDATTAYRILTNRAEDVFDQDAKARTRLADALANDGASLDGLMDAALVSAGIAKPWRHLMKRVEVHGPAEALAKQREEAIETLLQWGFGMSTSLVSNAQRLAEQDGLRRFLSATEGMEINEDETPAPAPAEESTSEPAPAPVQAPKVTPAQKRTLEAIRDNGVKLQEFRVAATRVQVERGERPRRDMVEFVIAQGWAHQDTSRPLFHGQPVTLTAVGEAILAG